MELKTKTGIIFFFLILTQIVFTQNKIEYLSKNRVDLRVDSPNIIEKNFVLYKV